MQVHKLLDLVLPDRCVLCDLDVRRREVHLCCPPCWQALPWLAPGCRHCALPLTGADGLDPGLDICGRCQVSPLVRGWCVAALRHDAEAQYLLARFKFNRGYREGQTLASALLSRVQQRYAAQPLPEWIVPVPLSWWGHARRTHNQAMGLGLFLARHLRLPCKPVLSRRHTRPQHRLDRDQRRTLEPHIFRVRGNVPAHVALVDDVLTTGSTVAAIAQVLMSAGARRVDVWCANRALGTVPYVHPL